MSGGAVHHTHGDWLRRVSSPASSGSAFCGPSSFGSSRHSHSPSPRQDIASLSPRTSCVGYD
eukprot:4400651-Pyramimonas_sp.AAC.1